MRLLMIGILVTCALAGCNSSNNGSMHFDRVTWSKTPEISRHVMVQDLVERDVLAGLTREQVEALLGPPGFESSAYITYLVDPATVLDVRFAASAPHLVEKVFTRVM